MFTIALAGNPNVGKSTVFNNLTGLRQHTGNWTGKTVDIAMGRAKHNGNEYQLADLPGLYSLNFKSPEEEVARDFICSQKPDVVVVVVGATALERNLILLFQIMPLAPRIILCLNLMDEAERKNIKIDVAKLEELLKIPVVPMSAKNKGETKKLLTVASSLLKAPPQARAFGKQTPAEIIGLCERIAEKTVTLEGDAFERERRIDKILTSKTFGIPIMLLFLGVIFFITIKLSNYPSEWLARLFNRGERVFSLALKKCGAPKTLRSALIEGVYRTTAWVVAVMLPPMTIFFPLFTLFEDLGYLPRIAFNLDKPFGKCGCSGKQCLTMCMGLGCNAVGVTGARIIDSPRERLIAITTNSFMPCNGRFPTLITVSGIFMGGRAANAFLGGIMPALVLTALLLTGVIFTFLASALLSRLLKGEPSSFCLELPPYRRPQAARILIRSLLDRTIFVLGRAVLIAVPAGLVIWLLGNIYVHGSPLLYYICSFFDPFARLLGMDGNIFTAFLLSFPANEILLPLAGMSYSSSASLSEIDTVGLSAVLRANGWTMSTAISVMIFSLFHFPCATTCLTIKKETRSVKWTLVSIAIPLLIGILLSMATTLVFRLAR